MPVDPLDNIMGGLLRKGAIDPASKQQRMARATSMRQNQGIPVPTVAANRKPAQTTGRENAPAQAPIPMQPSMTDIVIDQLNEAIVTLKVEVGREPDRGRKRGLERQIVKLREQVREMGGVPIEAHESVQEGIQKLKGFGAVGWESLEQEMQASGLYNEANQMKIEELQGAGKVPVRSYLEGLGYDVSWDQAGGKVVASKGTNAVNLDPSLFETMTVDQAGGQRTFSSQAFLDQLLKIGDAKAEVRIGEEQGVSRSMATDTPPELPDVWSNVNETLSSWGFQPQSKEELYETARLMAERAALGQKQLINRELARFEENWPNEFEQAKTKINEQAATMTAELQEDFASRGMYYSSIMANNVTNIDKETVNTIAEIAGEAATRVANLRDELRGVEQWEILEREVVYRELVAESRKEAMAMAQIRANVEIEAARNALAQWQTQVQASVQQQANDLERVKLEFERTDILQDRTAYAKLALTDTTIQKMLSSKGMWESFLNMPIEEQGVTIAKMLDFEDLDLKRKLTAAQVQALSAEAALSTAQAKAVGTAGGGTEDTDDTWTMMMLDDINTDMQALSSLSLMSAKDLQKPANLQRATEIMERLPSDIQGLREPYRTQRMTRFNQLKKTVDALMKTEVKGFFDSLISPTASKNPSAPDTTTIPQTGLK